MDLTGDNRDPRTLEVLHPQHLPAWSRLQRACGSSSGASEPSESRPAGRTSHADRGFWLRTQGRQQHRAGSLGRSTCQPQVGPDV